TYLLIVWLRTFVESRSVRLLVVALFLAEWHGPARFVHFYPIYVDPPFMVFLLGGLMRSEEHTSELQSRFDLVCRLLLEKKEHSYALESRFDLVCRLLLAILTFQHLIQLPATALSIT